jgi:micrococcal nuclease
MLYGLAAFVYVVVACVLVVAALIALYRRARSRPVGGAKPVLYGSGSVFLIAFVVMMLTAPAEETASQSPGQAEPTNEEKPKEERNQEPKQERPREAAGARASEPRQGAGEGGGSGPGPSVLVLDVVDGDTFTIAPTVRGTGRVRLIGVDTPEVYGGEERCGQEASSFTTRKLEGERVRLELGEDPFDPYDRLLAYVWVDGEMFNETLLEQGLASQVTYPPNDRYEARLIAAEARAKTPSCATATATASPTATATPIATASPAASPDAGGGAGAGGGIDKRYDAVDNLNCEDVAAPFPTPPGDPDNLDADGDGTACEA